MRTIRNIVIAITMLLSFILALDCEEIKPAPFNGTIFIDSDTITLEDPTTFVKLYYNGKGTRTMYDRRVEAWVNQEPFYFQQSLMMDLKLKFKLMLNLAII